MISHCVDTIFIHKCVIPFFSICCHSLYHCSLYNYIAERVKKRMAGGTARERSSNARTARTHDKMKISECQGNAQVNPPDAQGDRVYSGMHWCMASRGNAQGSQGVKGERTYAIHMKIINIITQSLLIRLLDIYFIVKENN